MAMAMFCLNMDKYMSMYAMNVIITTALTRELKPFEAPFLSADEPWFSWLKYQFSEYFKDCLTKNEVKPGVYEKSEKKICSYQHKY